LRHCDCTEPPDPEATHDARNGATIPVFERSAESRTHQSHRSARPSLRALAVVTALLGAGIAGAQGNLPLPPPPPGMTLVAPAAAPQPAVERCTGCHAQLTQRAVVHGAMQKHDCQACHRPAPSEQGKCMAKTASKWALVRSEPELCYGCHARKDQSKSIHTAVRQGSCLSCHATHASNFPGLLTSPRDKVCFDCHDAEPLMTKAVKHAPVAEGRCLECHDAHGGDLPNAIKAASGTAFCMKCHDAKAPQGKGTPGPSYRVDLSKPNVHAALKRTDCGGCHEAGHSGDNLKLLKKAAVDLCYGCHERKDRAKFPHGAVLTGDCAVCHDPHSSDNAKLMVKPTTQENCFLCHQDDLTGRKVVHAPVAKGCNQCHDPHGAQSRFALKAEGKDACYQCHKPVDSGKVKHAALERYGCTGCHDPHGTANGAMLAKRVNDLCVGCHPGEPDGRHATTLVPAGHVVGGELNDPRRPGRSFSCASCHNPHGSDNPRFFYYGADAMQSCDGCHGDKSGNKPELKNIVSRARRPAAGKSGVGSGAGGGSGGGASGSGGDVQEGSR
jgi:predicted CXXCH cytochrome family protein